MLKLVYSDLWRNPLTLWTHVICKAYLVLNSKIESVVSGLEFSSLMQYRLQFIYYFSVSNSAKTKSSGLSKSSFHWLSFGNTKSLAVCSFPFAITELGNPLYETISNWKHILLVQSLSSSSPLLCLTEHSVFL